MTLSLTLDAGRILRDGVFLSVAASALIMGALRANPRLFLRHFPEAVRRAQPALSPAETRAGRLVGMALIGMLVIVPVWSARASADALGYDFGAAFLHAFFVGMAFNVTDWLILDELWLGVGRPQWALPPGVTLDDVPFDHRQHARGFLVGTCLCALISGIAPLPIPPC